MRIYPLVRASVAAREYNPEVVVGAWIAIMVVVVAVMEALGVFAR